MSFPNGLVIRHFKGSVNYHGVDPSIEAGIREVYRWGPTWPVMHPVYRDWTERINGATAAVLMFDETGLIQLSPGVERLSLVARVIIPTAEHTGIGPGLPIPDSAGDAAIQFTRSIDTVRTHHGSHGVWAEPTTEVPYAQMFRVFIPASHAAEACYEDRDERVADLGRLTGLWNPDQDR